MQINEILTKPYHYSPRTAKQTVGKREVPVITASFKTADGSAYTVIGKRIGSTADERAPKQQINSPGLTAGPAINSQYQGGIWEFHFARGDYNKDSTGEITGTGDQYRIFATVLAFIKDQVQKYAPKIISIKAKADEDNRAALYSKLVSREAPGMGYQVVDTKQVGGYQRIQLQQQ